MLDRQREDTDGVVDLDPLGIVSEFNNVGRYFSDNCDTIVVRACSRPLSFWQSPLLIGAVYVGNAYSTS